MYLMQLVEVQGKRMSCFAIKEAEPKLPAEIQRVLMAFQDVFNEPKSLPPLREGHNHPIVLEEGTNPISLKPYRYADAQKDVIEKLEAELLEAGIVQESCSPFSAPVVLVKKKDGSWHMCVDYRELNKKTIKNQYPIPLVEDLFDELSKARWFTKLDLRASYHQIRMVPEDAYKTAFKTHSGHYGIRAFGSWPWLLATRFLVLNG